jgi:hypothetical protein
MAGIAKFVLFGALALAGGVAVVTPPYAVAQQRPSMERILKRMDVDGDGQVTRQEWLGNPKRFADADADDDNILTRAELLAHFGSENAPDGPDTGAKSAGQIAASPLRTGQYIDTHVHPTAGGPKGSTRPDNVRYAVMAAKSVLGENGFERAVLMPTPHILDKHLKKLVPMELIVNAARSLPQHFVYMGGGGSLNSMIHNESPDGNVSPELRARFERRAEEILAKGAVGFGELAALHLSALPNHSFESVQPDHPLFLLLADIAARHDVPIDLHLTPIIRDRETPKSFLRQSPLNPRTLKENVKAFERLLAHNPRAKIVWAHIGTALVEDKDVNLVRRLMERHPNLILQFGVIEGKVSENRTLKNGKVRSSWLKVMQDYPDRIVLGGDQFFSHPDSHSAARTFSRVADDVRKDFRKLLDSLPPDLARKIGFENAIQIYRLNW